MTPVANTRQRTRFLTASLAVLGCGLTIAACGSSGSSGSSNRPSAQQLRSDGLKFSQCMRSHGVPNFPDPVAGSGGHGFRISITPSSGIQPFSPSFKAAQSTCGKLLPGGGPSGHGSPSPQVRAHMLAISTCMRAHGFTDFPDPTTTPPTSASANVIGQDGEFLALPSNINPNSPAFKQAATACHFPGPPGGP
jgi:hypothetical protein